MTATMHLFGVIFDKEIEASGATAAEIARGARIESKVSAQIADGRNLARYFTVKPEVIGGGVESRGPVRYPSLPDDDTRPARRGLAALSALCRILGPRRRFVTSKHLIGPFVRRFLLKEVVQDRNLSPHTRKSYRDSLKLLFAFLDESHRTDPTRVTVEQVDATLVREFLSALEGGVIARFVRRITLRIAVGGFPGAGAGRSNQDHHRPGSCAPAKRCRRESRVALRALISAQAVLKPLARLKNDGSGSETVQNK